MQIKLLVAFLTIVGLLIALGAVSLVGIAEASRRAEEMIRLQRKIAAYRQLQYDTTAQLYAVSTALLSPETRDLDAILRQMSLFGYDLDRLQFVAGDEVEALGAVQADYQAFIRIVTESVELIRVGRADEGLTLLAQARPLAEQLERHMNTLVNRADADMVESVEAAGRANLAARRLVITFGLGTIALALLLGYVISWSLIAPVREMNARLQQIAGGDFTQRVHVPNRDELGTLAENLNLMSEELGLLYRRLAEASEHKSRFLARMSHELRTPLNAIIGFTRLVLRKVEGQIPDLQRENLRKVLLSAEDLLRLINELLDLSKIEAGKMEVIVETFPLGEVIESALTTIEPLLKEEVRVLTWLEDGLPELETDREKLKEIVINLLSNAAKFTERGQITVSASVREEVLILEVADTGIGIPAAALPDIFDEFHQAHTSGPRRHGGTGLGLTIVRRLAALLGGIVTARSEVGRGSTFTVTMPCASRGHGRRPDAQEGPHRRRQSAEPRPAHPGAGGRLRRPRG